MTPKRTPFWHFWAPARQNPSFWDPGLNLGVTIFGPPGRPPNRPFPDPHVKVNGIALDLGPPAQEAQKGGIWASQGPPRDPQNDPFLDPFLRPFWAPGKANQSKMGGPLEKGVSKGGTK
mgnify:CR=1 FL=1